MAKTIDPASDIRAEEAALARRKAEHDTQTLARAAELLGLTKAACDELGVLAGQILTPYVEAHLTALKLDRDRADMAVAMAEKALEAILNASED